MTEPTGAEMITGTTTPVGYAGLREAARYTSLSVSTLRRHIRAGRLKARKVGRLILVPVTALDALAGGPAPEDAT